MRYADELRDESMVAFTMDRMAARRTTDARTPRDASASAASSDLPRKIGSRHIVLGCERPLALQEQGSGSHDSRDDQNPMRGLAERSRWRVRAVRLGGRPIVQKVVDEGRVDDAIRSGRSAAQAIEIFERTQVYFRLRQRQAIWLPYPSVRGPTPDGPQFVIRARSLRR